MMDRRELLHRASMLLGGAISTSAMSGVLAGCVAGPQADGAAPAGFLTADEAATVKAMADQIIPRTDTPGALDVGVPVFIDRMLAGYYQDRERNAVRAGLRQVDADAKATGAASFAALSSDQQVALMEGYDNLQHLHTRINAGVPNAQPHFFRLIKELTIIGFCTSEQGATRLMNYNQNPGPYRGDVPLAEVGKASAL
jgi:gluconate 2-dehydrogenase gamma chain